MITEERFKLIAALFNENRIDAKKAIELLQSECKIDLLEPFHPRPGVASDDEVNFFKSPKPTHKDDWGNNY